MSDALRTAVIDAIAGDGGTLVEIHERTGEDSRRTLAMLHVLAGQKIATCAREERGMVWSLIDEADALERVEAPMPAPPPVARDKQAGIPMSERTEHSVRAQVLRYVLQLNAPTRSGDIIDALKLPAKQVHNQLYQLVNEGKIIRYGIKPTARYAPKGVGPCAGDTIQPDTAQAITRAIEKSAPRAGEIVLQVSVPFSKATAVLRAIEQALAA